MKKMKEILTSKMAIMAVLVTIVILSVYFMVGTNEGVNTDTNDNVDSNIDINDIDANTNVDNVIDDSNDSISDDNILASNDSDKKPNENSDEIINKEEVFEDDSQNRFENLETPLYTDKDGFIIEVGDEIGYVTKGGVIRNDLVAEGSRNILIIGEDTEVFLYDTIGVININNKTNKIKIIMFPRDIYIEYSDNVLKKINEAGKLDEPGYFKINNAHNIGYLMKQKGDFKVHSINFLHEVLLEKFSIDIDDYIKVNTSAFKELVDIFGGVEVDVPYLMNYEDPYQDLYIHLEKGVQTLDGEKAEGFVRFRQGYNESGTFIEYGDVMRKDNQISFLKAFIKQHGTISNINKTGDVLKSLKENIQHSIGLGDILLKYITIAKNSIINKYETESIVLDGELKKIRGSSYIILE